MLESALALRLALLQKLVRHLQTQAVQVLPPTLARELRSVLELTPRLLEVPLPQHLRELQMALSQGQEPLPGLLA